MNMDGALTIFSILKAGVMQKRSTSPRKKNLKYINAIKAGALVENAGFYPGTRNINFDDAYITENTRVSYPLNFISNSVIHQLAKFQKIFSFLPAMLSVCLPPISKLTPGQAMYQFISGYTAKVAGTEAGVTEPKPTFSACFGAPFLPLHPGKYAQMLGEKMEKHKVNVWMINTGWTGGPYGIGNRMKLKYTRAMITAALEGKLNNRRLRYTSCFRPGNSAGLSRVTERNY